MLHLWAGGTRPYVIHHWVNAIHPYVTYSFIRFHEFVDWRDEAHFPKAGYSQPHPLAHPLITNHQSLHFPFLTLAIRWLIRVCCGLGADGWADAMLGGCPGGAQVGCQRAREADCRSVRGGWDGCHLALAHYGQVRLAPL